MFIAFENISRSILHFMQTSLSGNIDVPVIEGNSYGIRLEDPVGKSPSVVVEMKDIKTASVELGSDGSEHEVVYSVNALSRRQRDALKYLVYQILKKRRIPIYSRFYGNTPVEDAKVLLYAEIKDPVVVSDMPNFSDSHESFFWVSIIYTKIVMIGI